MPKLVEYKGKRDFKKTPEPSGEIDESFCEEVKRKNKGKNLGERPIYVVQKHFARRLHFDLRLEFNKVLVSWAIPKEPPKAEGIKRLAIQTEDHPLEYSLFAGIIPKGNYGAGKVEIWDRGTFSVKYKGRDKIEFFLKGKKLKGMYILVKTKFARNSWLFFKVREKKAEKVEVIG
jgi:DNA ligase D-like protein (predicted 3'-phosphoesterase)